jgi:predicted MFS family arabinose efflux permease
LSDRSRADPALPEKRVFPGLLSARPWAAVILLTVVNMINYLDRVIPMILAEPLKRDLGLSDMQIGLLNGIGFTLIYAVMGLPIARLADRGRYGVVISLSLGLWSLMTALGSVVTSGWQLVLTRGGVAIGEAGNTPAAHAYISRRFAPEQRPAALAVFTMGTALGSMAGLAGGGLLAERLGWRGTLAALGLAGMIMAPLVILAIGPGVRHAGRQAGGAMSAFACLRMRSVVATFVAMSFMAMAAYTFSAFSPAFLMRVHRLSVGTVGLNLGLMQGTIGMIALLTTGVLAARLTHRDPRWSFGIVIVLIALTVPLFITGLLAESRLIATVCIGLSYGVMAAFLALTVAPLHSLVPVSMRAQTSAMLLFVSAIVGGLGPVFAGLISDALTPAHGPRALGWALFLVPLELVLAAAAYGAAARWFQRDLALAGARTAD